VLPEDEVAIRAFNAKEMGTAYEIMLDQIPSPYIGKPDAPVLLLNLNPGYAPDLTSEATQDAFARAARTAMEHGDSEYPFYPLDPALAGSAAGHEWWSLMLGPLIRASGRSAQEVSRKIFCVEYFPYHSVKYSWNGDLLPSQRYSHDLVGTALAAGARVIIMRSRKQWEEAVPALKGHPRVCSLKNHQRTFISEGNMDPKAFAEIVNLVQG